MFEIIIGEEIKRLRNKNGLSSRELARRSKISQPYLSQLETGKNNNPTTQILRKIANGLNIDYYDLLSEVGEISEEQSKLNKDLELMRNLGESEKHKQVKIMLPKVIQYYKHDENRHVSKNTNDNDVFDLFYFLLMDIGIFYKKEKIPVDEINFISELTQTILDESIVNKKTLTNEQKKKIITIIQTILE